MIVRHALLSLVIFNCIAFTYVSVEANSPNCLRDYLAAGVLPYTLESGDVWILLGHEPKDPHWTDFVGKREEEDCLPEETAAREFAEESRLAYPTSETSQRIRESKSHAVVIDDCKKVHIWVIQVGKIPAEEREELAGSDTAEKNNYCWMKLSDVLAAVDVGEPLTTAVPAHCTGNRPLHKDIYNYARKGQEMRKLLDSLLNEHRP